MRELREERSEVPQELLAILTFVVMRGAQRRSGHLLQDGRHSFRGGSHQPEMAWFHTEPRQELAYAGDLQVALREDRALLRGRLHQPVLHEYPQEAVVRSQLPADIIQE